MFNWLFKKRTHLPNSSQKKYHCKFTMPPAAWSYDGLKFGVWPVCTVWDSKQTHTHMTNDQQKRDTTFWRSNHFVISPRKLKNSQNNDTETNKKLKCCFPVNIIATRSFKCVINCL